MNPRYLYFLVTGRKPPRRSPRRPGARKPARNWRYRAWIRSLPSAISGAYGCEACHTGSDGGMSLKSSDYSCIPLTHVEHMRLHALGRKQFEALHEVNLDRIVSSLRHCWFAYAREVK